jgi:hypothetical protein
MKIKTKLFLVFGPIVLLFAYFILRPENKNITFAINYFNVGPHAIQYLKFGYGERFFSSVELEGNSYANSYSMLYGVPHKEIRVTWKINEITYDRTSVVEGEPILLPVRYPSGEMIVEIDSNCGRIRARWVGSVSKYRQENWNKENMECNKYTDYETPKGASILPDY